MVPKSSLKSLGFLLQMEFVGRLFGRMGRIRKKNESMLRAQAQFNCGKRNLLHQIFLFVSVGNHCQHNTNFRTQLGELLLKILPNKNIPGTKHCGTWLSSSAQRTSFPGIPFQDAFRFALDEGFFSSGISWKISFHRHQSPSLCTRGFF